MIEGRRETTKKSGNVVRAPTFNTKKAGLQNEKKKGTLPEAAKKWGKNEGGTPLKKLSTERSPRKKGSAEKRGGTVAPEPTLWAKEIL